MQPGQAEATARILDRLSEEIREAAGMLRSGTAPGARQPVTDPGPSCDPWSVVNLVTHDLARGGVKSRLGPEADLVAAAGRAAQLLDALGVVPVVPDDDPDAARTRPVSRPRIDGSVPVGGDQRVNRARELLAEDHQPITMTPGDLRTLLARYQRRVHELLTVIDGQPVIGVTGTSPRH